MNDLHRGIRLLHKHLKSLPCDMCNGPGPIAFHHINHKEKVCDVGDTLSRPLRYLREIQKCSLFCDGCMFFDHCVRETAKSLADYIPVNVLGDHCIPCSTEEFTLQDYPDLDDCDDLIGAMFGNANVVNIPEDW